MQTVSSRIWTLVTMSISSNYITGASNRNNFYIVARTNQWTDIEIEKYLEILQNFWLTQIFYNLPIAEMRSKVPCLSKGH